LYTNEEKKGEKEREREKNWTCIAFKALFDDDSRLNCVLT